MSKVKAQFDLLRATIAKDADLEPDARVMLVAGLDIVESLATNIERIAEAVTSAAEK